MAINQIVLTITYFYWLFSAFKCIEQHALQCFEPLGWRFEYIRHQYMSTSTLSTSSTLSQESAHYTCVELNC